MTVFFVLLALLLMAAMLVVVGMSLFVRRHGDADDPGAGWSPTDEVLSDPGTDHVMRVWSDASGGRHYVPEGTRPTGHP